MWINDQVTYTPEITIVTKGEPVTARVKAVGSDETLVLDLPSGEEIRVDASQCVKVNTCQHCKP